MASPPVSCLQHPTQNGLCGSGLCARMQLEHEVRVSLFRCSLFTSLLRPFALTIMEAKSNTGYSFDSFVLHRHDVRSLFSLFPLMIGFRRLTSFAR